MLCEMLRHSSFKLLGMFNWSSFYKCISPSWLHYSSVNPTPIYWGLWALLDNYLKLHLRQPQASASRESTPGSWGKFTDFTSPNSCRQSLLLLCVLLMRASSSRHSYLFHPQEWVSVPQTIIARLFKLCDWSYWSPSHLYCEDKAPQYPPLWAG